VDTKGALITLYNLTSFFSDLEQIMFMNEKFKLPTPPPTAMMN
jgi:hypothetical protein